MGVKYCYQRYSGEPGDIITDKGDRDLSISDVTELPVQIALWTTKKKEGMVSLGIILQNVLYWS